VSGAATNTKFVFTGRWIPEKSDAGQLFFSGAYWLTKQWSVGLDYRPLVDKVYPNSNLRVLNEDPNSLWKPAVIIGTSAEDFTNSQDQDVESRAWFGTVSKALPKIEALDLRPSPYLGAVWIQEFEELRPLAGLHLRHPIANAIIQYSGTNTHVSLSRKLNDNVTFNLHYWGLKYPGLSFAFKF